MARNLDARHHYFSCRRAYSEAQKKVAAYMQTTAISPRHLEVLRIAEDYAERALSDAHLDWAQAERVQLLAESPAFNAAFGEMMGLQRSAEMAHHAYSLLLDALHVARTVFGPHGSEKAAAAEFMIAVNAMLTGPALAAAETSYRQLAQQATARSHAVSKLFDAHLETLERMAESEVA